MTALRFSEGMKGWVSFDEHDYNQAVLAGRRARNSCSFRLRMDVEDVDRFVADPEHEARASGTVRCDQLGGELEVERGEFNLFVAEPDERHRRMKYRLFLRDEEGRRLTLRGFKVLEDDPNHDVWTDSSRLLVRVLAGHVPERDEREEDPRTLATGILYISRLGFLRLIASHRASGGSMGDRLRALVRFAREFMRGLRVVYRGRPVPDGQSDFPTLTPGATPLQGRVAGEWHPCPGRPGLRRRIVPFPAGDGYPLNLHNIRGERQPDRGPVLLIAGTSVRANILYGAPLPLSLVDVLVEEGYDVWIENWRASIDFAPHSYTLDQAAVHDHPAAVREIRRHTGAEELKAMVHCQGSTSFMISALAGLVPEVTTVVSNAVSLHVNLTLLSALKVRAITPVAGLVMEGVDPQWAVRAPAAVSAGLAAWTRLVRRDCGHPVCAMSTYVYGAGPDVLWRHANLTAATHDWVAREFAFAPFTFFRQMRRSVRARHLVPVDGLPELPDSYVAEPPLTDARFTFLAGSRNVCFLPEGQRRTFEYLDALRPGYHDFRLLDGYSHLDVFFGRRSHRDVYPVIVEALERGPDGRAGAGRSGRRRAARGRRIADD